MTVGGSEITMWGRTWRLIEDVVDGNIPTTTSEVIKMFRSTVLVRRSHKISPDLYQIIFITGWICSNSTAPLLQELLCALLY